MYGPPFVGKHRDTFRRSSLCDLPPLAPSPPSPGGERIRKIPLCRDSKRLRLFVPRHLVSSADCYWVFPRSFYVSLCMVRFTLLQKHLETIPPNILITNIVALSWDRPRRGHLRNMTTYQLRRPAQPVPATHFRDRRLPLLPPPMNGNRHSKPTPWPTPLQRSEEFLNSEGEDQM